MPRRKANPTKADLAWLETMDVLRVYRDRPSVRHLKSAKEALDEYQKVCLEDLLGEWEDISSKKKT